MTRRKSSLKKRKLTLIERIYVQHVHPVNAVMTMIGWMWGAYFLWSQNILLAIAFGVGFPLIGHLAVWGHGEEELAETSLGKAMLIHAHPMNMLFHIVGAIVILLGLYAHVVELILWGVSLHLFGHMWGWSRVNLLDE